MPTPITFFPPDRSQNDAPSQNQHYPSMSEVGNILVVWESRGAYRMMSLILRGNLSPSPSFPLIQLLKEKKGSHLHAAYVARWLQRLQVQIRFPDNKV